MVPVVASNRIGIERDGQQRRSASREHPLSPITGETTVRGGRYRAWTLVLTVSFDLDELAAYRREVCVFRDRRPECYQKFAHIGRKE